MNANQEPWPTEPNGRPRNVTPASVSSPGTWLDSGSRRDPVRTSTPPFGVAAPPPPPLSGASLTSAVAGTTHRVPAGWQAVSTHQPPAVPGRPSFKVDWPNCKGHALCHELLPELIDLDEWGFPLIRNTSIPEQHEDLARKAVVSCPTLALRILDPTQAHR